MDKVDSFVVDTAFLANEAEPQSHVENYDLLLQDVGKRYIAVISAHQQGLSEADNARLFKELEKYIGLAGFGFRAVRGLEKGFVVYSKNESTMLMVLTKLCKKYDQQAFLFMDLDSSAWLYHTQGVSKGIKEHLGIFSDNTLSHFYARVGKSGIQVAIDEVYHKDHFTTFTGMLHENFMKCIAKYDDWDERWEKR